MVTARPRFLEDAQMNINDFCGIAVTVALVVAVSMFVALIVELNRKPRNPQSQRESGARIFGYEFVKTDGATAKQHRALAPGRKHEPARDILGSHTPGDFCAAKVL